MKHRQPLKEINRRLHSKIRNGSNARQNNKPSPYLRRQTDRKAKNVMGVFYDEDDDTAQINNASANRFVDEEFWSGQPKSLYSIIELLK